MSHNTLFLSFFGCIKRKGGGCSEDHSSNYAVGRQNATPAARGADTRPSTPGLDPPRFCSEFPGPSSRPVAFAVQLRGSGRGPHHAASGIARPRAAHGWGGAWMALSPPPREDLPHPGRPPHSRGGFRPGRRSGRKARAGHRPGGKARPAFPAFPPPPPPREGGGPAVPHVCSAPGSQPTPGANASPTRKPLSRAGRHTRLPPPLPPRTRGREWPPLPPRNVNATSAVVVMPRGRAHSEPPAPARRAQSPPPRRPVLLPGGAPRAAPGAQGGARDAPCEACPGTREAVAVALPRRQPRLRLGVWGTASRSPAAGFPKPGHVCMHASGSCRRTRCPVSPPPSSLARCASVLRPRPPGVLGPSARLLGGAR